MFNNIPEEKLALFTLINLSAFALTYATNTIPQALVSSHIDESRPLLAGSLQLLITGANFGIFFLYDGMNSVLKSYLLPLTSMTSGILQISRTIIYYHAYFVGF